MSVIFQKEKKRGRKGGDETIMPSQRKKKESLKPPTPKPHDTRHMKIQINKPSTMTIPKLSSKEAEDAIESFVKIIQYQTVSATAPETGAYTECAKFLIEQLESIPCLDEIHVLENSPDHSPVVMARWKGVDESLPVILLNSHYDVVPAVEEDWDVPCWGSRKDGRVYGRGAQDMKCV